MEESPDTPDLNPDQDRMEALERRHAALLRDYADLEKVVAEQQTEVVAARELAVHVARLELENAEQALSIERMRERLRQHPRAPEEEDTPVMVQTTLRAGRSPRMLAVPELRWIAEIVEAE